MPHGVKETRCDDCGQTCYLNALSGHMVDLHTRSNPVWGATGPMERLERVIFPAYTLHRCSKGTPVLLQDSAETLEELRSLGREMGVLGLEEATLEEVRELLVSVFGSMRSELAALRSGAAAAEYQEQIDGLTRALTESEKRRLELELEREPASQVELAKAPPVVVEPAALAREAEASAALAESGQAGQSKTLGRDDTAAAIAREHARRAPEGVKLGRKGRKPPKAKW